MSSQITFDKNRYHQHREMEEWCYAHIGPGGWRPSPADDGLWSIESMFGMTTFTFQNGRDYTMFLLRWGS